MHLYSKPIADISWEDVAQFCERKIVENSYLDYKKEFPKDLAKTIAAMANTIGGIVLIGVDETDIGSPILPIEGIKTERGLEERVLNLVLDAISPPVIPEVTACSNPVGDRTVVVVRIPQSEHAPHALHSNTAVYIRTGKRNNPEDFADLDRIEWLRDRRKKAENLREWIFERARMRFRDMRDGNVLNVAKTDEGHWPAHLEQPGLLTLALCPLYPDKVLSTPAALEKIRRSIVVRDYIGTGHQFPLQESGCISRMVEDGYVMHFSGKRGLRTYHTHLNMHGLYFYRQSLLYQVKEISEDIEDERDPEARLVIRGYEIAVRLYEIVESGDKFYRELGYSGPLKFRLRLEGLLGIPFLMPEFEGSSLINVERASTDPEIDTFHVVRMPELGNRIHDAVLPLFERVCWAFNSHASIDTVKSLYGYMRRR